MGFKLADLFVSITAQDSAFQSSIGAAHRALLGLANSASGLATLGIFGAGGALTVGLGISGKVAVDLEQKMVALAKATDLDPSGMALLQNQLFKLAVTLKGVSLDSLIAIATNGAKMGIAAGDLAEYAEGIAKVSTAMDDIPADQIADRIGKVNSVFKLGVQGALQLGSAIDKLADSGVSSASGILDVTQRLSGAAKVANLTAAETTALAAALLDTGTQAELGASALGRLILALNNVEAHKSFGKILGEDATRFAARVKAGPMQAIQDFLTALKKLDAGSQAVALKGIGIEGVQSIGEIQKLAQQVDTVRDYAAKARHEFETLDQVNKSYAASSQTIGAKLVQVKNQFLILANKIGSALMPAIGGGLDLLGGLTEAIGVYVDNLVIGSSRLLDRFQQFPAIIDSVFGEGTVSRIQSIGTEGLDFVADKLELFGILMRNFPDFFDVLVLHGTQAFLNLGETIAVLPENLAIIGDYIKNNWSKLIVDGVNLAISAFKNLGTNLANLTSAIVKFMKDPTQGFAFNWTDLTQGFEATAAALPGLVAPALTSLQDQIDEKLREIAERENRAAAAAKLGKEPATKPTKAGDEADNQGTSFGKTGEKGTISDLPAFVKSLQEAVGGRGNAAERTAKAAERTAKATERLANAKPMPAGALGPDWQMAGLV